MSSSKITVLPSWRGASVPAAFACRARSTRSGVAGCCGTQTPTASWIAEQIAGPWALLAISPIALAPNGPSAEGFSTITEVISGKSGRPGMRYAPNSPPRPSVLG